MENEEIIEEKVVDPEVPRIKTDILEKMNAYIKDRGLTYGPTENLKNYIEELAEKSQISLKLKQEAENFVKNLTTNTSPNSFHDLLEEYKEISGKINENKPQKEEVFARRNIFAKLEEYGLTDPHTKNEIGGFLSDYFNHGKLVGSDWVESETKKAFNYLYVYADDQSFESIFQKQISNNLADVFIGKMKTLEEKLKNNNSSFTPEEANQTIQELGAFKNIIANTEGQISKTENPSEFISDIQYIFANILKQNTEKKMLRSKLENAFKTPGQNNQPFYMNFNIEKDIEGKTKEKTPEKNTQEKIQRLQDEIKDSFE